MLRSIGGLPADSGGRLNRPGGHGILEGAQQRGQLVQAKMQNALQRALAMEASWRLVQPSAADCIFGWQLFQRKHVHSFQICDVGRRPNDFNQPSGWKELCGLDVNGSSPSLDELQQSRAMKANDGVVLGRCGVSDQVRLDAAVDHSGQDLRCVPEQADSQGFLPAQFIFQHAQRFIERVHHKVAGTITHSCFEMFG